MKNSFYSLLIILLGATLLMMSCNQGDNRIEIEDSFSYIEQTFAQPPAEYQTAPFWVWNEVVSRDKIREQLTEFKEKGIGGVYVHPRYGLVTEYLGDEWFEMFEYAMEVARELDMYVWIYDENSFPSGFAGGLVPHEMPESYNQGQGIKLIRQAVLQPDTNKEYLHIIKMKSDGTYGMLENVDAEIGNTGDYYLFEKLNYDSSKWYAGYSYVDLIYPGVTEKFIEITMRGYEKYSDDFGKLIPGVFTDEPNIAPPRGQNIIRWTPDLYERFYERWGYRLEDNLLS